MPVRTTLNTSQFTTAPRTHVIRTVSPNSMEQAIKMFNKPFKRQMNSSVKGKSSKISMNTSKRKANVSTTGGI